MNKDEFFDIVGMIEMKKMELLRELNDDEIALIFRENPKLSFFQKRNVVRGAKRGTGDVWNLYRAIRDHKGDFQAEQKEFISKSFGIIELKLKRYAEHCADPLSYSLGNLEDYWEQLMRFIYMKDRLGLPIDEHKQFIDYHRDLYNKVFNEKVNGKNNSTKQNVVYVKSSSSSYFEHK